MSYSGRVLFTGNDLRHLAIAFMRGAQLHDIQEHRTLLGGTRALSRPSQDWSHLQLEGKNQQYSLGSEAGEIGIIDARIHESGLVALTGSLTFLEVKEWSGGKPLTLANPGLSQPPQSWVVIPPDETISRHVELLLSVETTIYGVDNL
ncbi:hypothetical protein DICSQDRAFT_184265 [Dichomitus squalens LYAD-421 SS1]|uniref:Uncharacterized protein n=1 Tax=Dichomitus squalens (strain LYAD-421) TaxID=732165 RepID=R7SKL2_DICSQ|nr:uncharacterized protein DICSQDRAFT_184265 [Dichomitus squalens LYAD-421 SS1]EJF55597.1 hypothetical protein DICSQDRAFT_184265 [Dichomitus squalens LYAD-421 SS1]